MERYEIRVERVYPNSDDERGVLTVDDDEEILSVDTNRPSQTSAAVDVVLSRPTTARRCMATTGDGQRCRRDAAEGSDYCGLPGHGSGES